MAGLSRHVALLRAVNVGSARKVPMAELRATFEGLGARDVRTYIQSGNVVYTGALDADAVRAALSARFGFDIPVVLRSAAAMDTLRNPWPDADPAIVAVAFLGAAPPPERLARLDPARIAPDELRPAGAELWMRCPTTFAKTRITVDWLERHLGTAATVRNLRTTTLLADWANGRA